MVTVDPTLVEISQWAGLIGAASLVMIGLGEFLRRANPMLWPFPTAAEVLGWLSWVGLSVVESLVARDGVAACAPGGTACPSTLWDALWVFASPYTRDLVVGLVVTAVAWTASTAWVWARRRARAGSRSGARAA